MVKLEDKINFIDDFERSFTGIVVKIHPNDTLDIKVRRKIGHEPQIFLKVPKEIKDQKNKPKPRYIEIKKETPKKKE